jgi:hypothetical protein
MGWEADTAKTQVVAAVAAESRAAKRIELDDSVTGRKG